jgi:predicted alpha/beta superfamily hydrolase
MVEFKVTVPSELPPWEPVYLTGDGDVMGHWRADSIRLERWGDGTFHTKLDLAPGANYKYLVTRGHWRHVESDGHGHERPPRQIRPQRDVTVDIHVSGWGRNSIRYHPDFASEYLPTRRPIVVYLPAEYELHPSRRFPVLYMNDGQNLFDPGTAFGGVAWGCDNSAEQLARNGEAESIIIVGVGNTIDRMQEYAPRRITKREPFQHARNYGRFLVEELKPMIDAKYRTLTEPEHTGIGGSSLGGLISLHLCKWHANVFGICAAMSPSLWWDKEYFVRAARTKPAWLKHCRIWLDMGGQEGHTDASKQGNIRRARQLAEILKELGQEDGRDFTYCEDPHAHHTESDWAKRFPNVLRFLYPTRGHAAH